MDRIRRRFAEACAQTAGDTRWNHFSDMSLFTPDLIRVYVDHPRCSPSRCRTDESHANYEHLLMQWGAHNRVSASEMNKRGISWRRLLANYPLTLDDFDNMPIAWESVDISANSTIPRTMFTALVARGITRFHVNTIDPQALSAMRFRAIRCVCFHNCRMTIADLQLIREHTLFYFRQLLDDIRGIDCSQWTHNELSTTRHCFNWEYRHFINARDYNIFSPDSIFDDGLNATTKQCVNLNVRAPIGMIHNIIGLSHTILFNRSEYTTVDLILRQLSADPTILPMLIRDAVVEYSRGCLTSSRYHLTAEFITALSPHDRAGDLWLFHPDTTPTRRERILARNGLRASPELLVAHYAWYADRESLPAAVFALAVFECEGLLSLSDGYVAMREGLLSVRASANDDGYFTVHASVNGEGLLSVRASANDDGYIAVRAEES